MPGEDSDEEDDERGWDPNIEHGAHVPVNDEEEQDAAAGRVPPPSATALPAPRLLHEFKVRALLVRNRDRT